MSSSDEDLLALDAALEETGKRKPPSSGDGGEPVFRRSSVAETAAILGVSESAIERDWRAAKAWLASRIRPHEE